MARNFLVEKAVRDAISRIDAFISEDSIELPKPRARQLCEQQLKHSSASVRVASLFFAFYSKHDQLWDCDQLPIGYRGKSGDKLLSEQLTIRSLTIHSNITAFGENLGWKGNKVNVSLHRDPHFQEFCDELATADFDQRTLIADYLATRFAESRRIDRPLPPVGPNVLTFAKAKGLFSRLLQLPTQGHVQQFLVAALLRVHRRRYGFDIRTYHPQGSDTSSNTAGDIEERLDGNLVRAYEVTVRSDWKNRVSNFKLKMEAFNLSKYIIIASQVNNDEELAEPAKLITFLKPYGRDIAVIDINDFTLVMAAELSANELKDAVNLINDYLSQPNLSNKDEFIELYRNAVSEWLDED